MNIPNLVEEKSNPHLFDIKEEEDEDRADPGPDDDDVVVLEKLAGVSLLFPRFISRNKA